MDEPEILFFTCQILKGLSYLHSCDPPIIHLDLKGDNIVLTEDKKTAKLCDMDKSREMKSPRTTPSAVSYKFGTVSHMSPEMLKFDEDPRTRSPVGRTTDIWSLGCVVLEMLGKGDFFVADNNGQSLSMINNTNSTSLIRNGHSPEIPITTSDDLKSFLMECFNRDPLQRTRAAELLGHRILADECRFDEEGPCLLLLHLVTPVILPFLLLLELLLFLRVPLFSTFLKLLELLGLILFTILIHLLALLLFLIFPLFPLFLLFLRFPRSGMTYGIIIFVLIFYFLFLFFVALGFYERFVLRL